MPCQCPKSAPAPSPTAAGVPAAPPTSAEAAPEAEAGLTLASAPDAAGGASEVADTRRYLTPFYSACIHNPFLTQQGKVLSLIHI